MLQSSFSSLYFVLSSYNAAAFNKYDHLNVPNNPNNKNREELHKLHTLIFFLLFRRTKPHFKEDMADKYQWYNQHGLVQCAMQLLETTVLDVVADFASVRQI